MVTNYSKGLKAEKAIATRLRRLGYKVQHLFLGGCDLIATHKETGENFRIEVKFSSINSAGYFSATTYKRNHTDYKDSDVLIMVCERKNGLRECYVIPTGAINAHTVKIGSKGYNGKYATYKEAWDVMTA